MPPAGFPTPSRWPIPSDRDRGPAQGKPLAFNEERALWAATPDRFCLALGATAGNIGMAQGATAVVIAGRIGLRIADHLPRSGFRSRFIAKGWFERMMDKMPVELITRPQPGPIDAAAFAEKFGG